MIAKKCRVFHPSAKKAQGPKKYKNQLSQFYTGHQGHFRAPSKRAPSPLRTKKFFPEVGHVIARWNGLDEYNKKPNGDICPKIYILAGNGQKGPLELKSTPYC